MGEDAFRHWFTERMAESRLPLYVTCLLGETGATALVGAGLVYWSDGESRAFDIGCGIVAYAFIVLFYTLLSLWRLRRGARMMPETNHESQTPSQLNIEPAKDEFLKLAGPGKSHPGHAPDSGRF